MIGEAQRRARRAISESSDVVLELVLEAAREPLAFLDFLEDLDADSFERAGELANGGPEVLDEIERAAWR